MKNRLFRLALAVLLWNLLVIGWGAFVRASGSGAGCGAHWPLCDGEVIPRAPSAERAIEFTHRATSGLALLAGVLLALAARRWRPRGHPARRAAAVALLFLLAEAALGAGLVLFELVGDDASATRAVVMALHLVNTLGLFGALALTLHHAEDGRPLGRARDPRAARLGALALALLLATGATGAIAALGDTLFPATSLAHGLAQDLSPASHFLLRLRVLHVPIAIAATLAVLALGWHLTGRHQTLAGADATTARRARWAGALALGQLVLGAINLGLLAPIPLQLAHLLLADLVWIATILALAAALARPPRGAATAG